MAKCLVLGGNGFIGSYIVDSLIDLGHKVRVFDRFEDRKTLFIPNKNIEIYSKNFLNRSDIADSLLGIDYVFHFISTTTPATAENDPLIDINTNIAMSVALFEECKKANIKKIVFASTGGAIYGDSSAPNREEDSVKPISPYAIGKLTIENYLRYYNEKYGMDYLIVRISNPYGPRQPFYRNQGVIPIFLENIYNNKDINIYGDGNMKRDYIYVEDVASAITKIFNKKSKYKIYNIGSGKATSINELVDSMKKVTDKDININHLPSPSTYLNVSILNVSRYESEFGRISTYDLLLGMQNTYKYICDHCPPVL